MREVDAGESGGVEQLREASVGGHASPGARRPAAPGCRRRPAAGHFAGELQGRRRSTQALSSSAVVRSCSAPYRRTVFSRILRLRAKLLAATRLEESSISPTSNAAPPPVVWNPGKTQLLFSTMTEGSLPEYKGTGVRPNWLDISKSLFGNRYQHALQFETLSQPQAMGKRFGVGRRL